MAIEVGHGSLSSHSVTVGQPSGGHGRFGISIPRLGQQ
jgi:hypothetical protein